MTETTKTLAEVLSDLAQQTINRNEPFGVIGVPLQIQVSSDHSEIHMSKGDLHLMIAMTGEDTGIFDCNNWFGECIQNPFWINNLKVADVISDIWDVSYKIDRIMSKQTETVTEPMAGVAS
jgi:hypothetical protein